MKWVGTSVAWRQWAANRASSAAVAIGILVLFVGAAGAEEHAAPAIRRLYVPEAELSRVVQGLLPMRRSEFERLYQEQARRAESPTRERIPIRRADYFARFENGQLVDGQAHLTVEPWTSERGRASFGELGLPVHDLRWAGSPNEKVIAGLDASGALLLEATETSALTFGWSLASQVDGGNGFRFRFALPRSSVSRLALQLPADWRIATSAGVVTRQDDELLRELDSAVVPPADELNGETIWLIELSGATTFEVEVRSAAGELGVGVQQSLAYRVTDAGLELSATLSLDVAATIGSLDLRMDPGLRVTSARLGERQLEFRVGEQSMLTIDFEPSLLPGRRDLELTALAPLTLGQEFELPSFSVAAARWSQGEATLEIPQAFELQFVEPRGYVETGVEPLPAPRVGEVRSYRAFSADAGLRVLFGHHRGRLSVTTATALRLTEAAITANQVALVGCQVGEVYSLRIRSPGAWNVDSIQTLPADFLDSVITTGRNARIHHLRLRQPISATQQVQVLVRAHRRAPTGARQQLFEGDFRPVQFLGLGERRNYVSLLAELPLQLRFFNDARLERVLLQDLDPEIRDLIDWPPGSILYADEPQRTTFGVDLRARVANYLARTAVAANVSVGRVEYKYTVDCEPQSGALSRVQVRVMGPVPERIRWTVDGEDELSATRLGDFDGGAVWELSLRAPRAEPFQIVGTTRGPLELPGQLTLLSLPNAAAQTTHLSVAAADGSSLAVEGPGIRSVPGAVLPEATTRGHFRYDPGSQRPVILRRVETDGQPSVAWVWRCEVTSNFDQAGAGNHRAVIELENLGTPRALVRIPVVATVEEAFVNGVPVALASTSPQRNAVSIALPRGERHCVIQINYKTNSRPLGVVSTVGAPLPEFDLPCLQRAWTVWLSPGYRPVSTPLDQQRWDERLFGTSLLRLQAAPFNPLSATQWMAFANRFRDAAPATMPLVDSVVQTIGRTGRGADGRLTWGSVVQYYSDSQRSSFALLPPLYIDDQAMLAAGITPNSPLRWLSDGDRLVEVSDWLEGDNLALVVHSDRTLLTGIATLPEKRDDLISTRYPHVFVARELRLAASRDGLIQPDHLSTSAWLAQERDSTGRLARLPADVMGYGWTNRSIELQPGQDANLRIVRAPVVFAVGWAVAIITAAGVLCLQRERRRRLPYAVVLAGGVTLLAPAGIAAVPRGVFLGLLLAIAILACRRGKERSRSSRRLQSTPMYAAGVGMAVWCWMALQASAQQPSAPSAERSQIVVPVNEELEVVGDVVYVPRALYDALTGQSVRSAVTPWLLESARYEASLTSRRDRRVRVAQLTANFQVRTLHPRTQIELPLLEREIARLSATVDGHPVQAVWRDGSLQLEAATAGSSQIRIVIEPLVEERGDLNRFGLSIPPVPVSQLSVNGPAEMSGLMIEGALGATLPNAEQGPRLLTSVDLGPTDAFEVSWRSTASQAPRRDLRVRRLQWLHVQPDSLMLDVVHEVNVTNGQLSELQLLVPPQLELQDSSLEEPIAEYIREDGPSGPITVRLDRIYGVGSQLTFRTRFVVADSVGIGRLEVPEVRIVGESSVTPWLAASLPSSITASATLDAGARAVTAAEFAMLWPTEDARPTLVYRLDSAESKISFELQPRAPELSVTQETRVSAGMKFARLRYSAEVATSGAAVLRHRLTVPAGIEITSISVPNGEYDGLLRWTRPTPDTVVLFYKEPAPKLFRVELRGAVPVPLDGALAVPQITFMNSAVQEDQVHFFRQDDVDLQLEGVTLRRVLTSSGDDEGSYVGSIDDRSQAATLTANVAVNQPTARAVSTTELEYDGVSWIATVDVRLRVDGGVVDRVRLDVPGDWDASSLTVLPVMESTLAAVPGTQRKTLTIRPSEPISQGIEFSVRVQLTNPPDLDFQAPDVAVLDMASAERYLRLPRRIGSRLANWVTRGLESQPDDGRAAVYRVTGRTMQASLSDVERARGQSQLHLADYQVSLRADGTCAGVAAFDVEPARQQFCILRVPEGIEIIQATVGGVPAVQEAGAEGEPWILRLGSDRLPQRIEVLFTGKQPTSSPIGDRRIVAPTLVELPAIQTLWTVEYEGRQRLRPLLQHTSVPLTKQLELRLQTVRELLEIANSDERARTASSEYDAWRRPWLDLAGYLETGLQLSNERDGAVLRTVNVGAADTLGYAAHWRSHSKQSEDVHSAVQGDAPEIIVEYEGGGLPRSLVILTMIAVGMGAVSVVRAGFSRTAILGDWMSRWPHAVGVLIGVAFWLVATPSLLGWTLILLFVISSVRPYWRRTSRPTGSADRSRF